MTRSIEIIGGGLAGLSLGIALAKRGVAVRVLEAGTYPRHRVCGEFISGVSPDCLETLGITPAFEGAVPLRSALWFDEGGRVAGFDVPACGISRWTLDARLADLLVDAGGELETGVRVSEPARDVEGRVVAAGRPRRSGRWVGLKAHYADLPSEADLEMHMGIGGYVGLARIEGGMVNVCGLFRADRVDRTGGADRLPGTLEACGLAGLAARLRAARCDVLSLSAVAGFQLGWQPVSGFAIGDSAAMIPPFTGNGMSMAFESASDALESLMPYCEGKTDWATTTDDLRARSARRFRRRMRWAGLLHGALTTPAATRLAAWSAKRRLLPFPRLLSLVR